MQSAPKGLRLHIGIFGRRNVGKSSIINSLTFSPNRYWLCAATNKNITIWDLESKNMVVELPYPKADDIGPKALTPFCTSLAWSADGNTLYSGWTDNVIRVYAVSS